MAISEFFSISPIPLADDRWFEIAESSDDEDNLFDR
jgi:hypothetical protein